ncbi:MULTISPECIES: PstA family ABC transporter permease [unclassified Nostoc]|uniref:PstA family ABC transporter permease n=1 Tax=unclassified Nostoc TaxID=2593658 RepID=UPI002AD59E11|nr:ABC transporter permease subunit [Nostoc sp. DedQUE03]MDZ7977169.1 ABC transporter permease subunit [Nostoc sp. DedQUE03]MDZ8044022.1 ABC transporter permease subunit [Nostoc sp. DedQUE02]
MTSTPQKQQFNQSVDENFEHSYAHPETVMDLVLTSITFVLLGITLLPLLLVLGYVVFKGASRFNLELFIGQIPVALEQGGGIGSAIVGTLITVAIASIISIPFGILAAVYLSEFSSAKVADSIRFATNVLSGVSSIIIGIFAYGVLVVTTGKFSAFAGGFALAILMLPIIVKSADEALQLVPKEVRWASAGVGSTKFQSVLQVVLPAALPTILTGITFYRFLIAVTLLVLSLIKQYGSVKANKLIINMEFRNVYSLSSPSVVRLFRAKLGYRFFNNSGINTVNTLR